MFNLPIFLFVTPHVSFQRGLFPSRKFTQMGAKGHFRFGSVAEKVVKNSPVPVVAIPVQEEA
jgi:hypothetical protein